MLSLDMSYGFAGLMDFGLPTAFRFDLDLDSGEEITAQCERQ
jgi:hypothetical protein